MVSRILFLLAGTNEPSNSATLADSFLEGMKSVKDMKIEKIYLKDIDLHQFTLDDYKPDAAKEPEFARIEKLMMEADGIVVASPVWNFSVPAHLKNLIDRMGAFALDQEFRSKGTLGGKPFYAIFTGGSPMTAWTTLQKKTTSHLQAAFRYFGATPVGVHYEPKCTAGRGKFGLVVDKRPESLALMKKKGEWFGKIVERYAKDGSLPMMQNMFSKGFRFGSGIVRKVLHV